MSAPSPVPPSPRAAARPRHAWRRIERAAFSLRLRLAARPHGPPPVLLADAQQVRRSLGLPMIDADAIAREAEVRAGRICLARDRLGPAAVRYYARSLAGVVDRSVAATDPGAGPWLVSMPLHELAIAVIAGLLLDGRRVVVSATAPARALLGASGAVHPRLSLMEPALMPRRAREAAGAAEPTVYVTFPESMPTTGDVRWKGTLFDEPHLFSLLDALLLHNSGATMLVLEEDATGVRLAVAKLEDRSGPGDRLEAERIDEVVRAGAGAAEALIRARPAGLLSWGWLGRNRLDEVLGRELRDIGTMRGFVEAWRELGPGLDSDVAREALDRLDELEHRARASARSLN